MQRVKIPLPGLLKGYYSPPFLLLTPFSIIPIPGIPAMAPVVVAAVAPAAEEVAGVVVVAVVAVAVEVVDAAVVGEIEFVVLGLLSSLVLGS